MWTLEKSDRFIGEVKDDLFFEENMKIQDRNPDYVYKSKLNKIWYFYFNEMVVYKRVMHNFFVDNNRIFIKGKKGVIHFPIIVNVAYKKWLISKALKEKLCKG